MLQKRQIYYSDSKINPFNVVLEVTEREAVEDYDLFKEAATYYSDIGFAIAVDDTGAGYSSLETVVELKPKYIKLDISIIREIDKNILKQELIKAIVGLSKKMHSIVIAEGIETEEELNTLKEIGINFGQGFLFGKPAPPFPDICR
jgi:EAL domain-containing protein (putative c-di-GMP-specific phosphodiesterase class I)